MVRKRRTGSNSEAAFAGATSPSVLTSSSAAIVRTRDIFQEREVGDGRNLDAAQRAARDGNIGFAPEADIRCGFGDRALDLRIQSPPLRIVGRGRRGVEQPIDLRILEVSAVEACRRYLRRVEDAAQDVGIGDGATDPLQREQLEISL